VPICVEISIGEQGADPDVEFEAASHRSLRKSTDFDGWWISKTLLVAQFLLKREH
jgi:hypothetical protein